jgi:hypothetical protein
MRLPEDPVIEGWTALKPMNMIGPTVYQWDGGADQMVHSKWSRSLPAFDLQGAHIMAGASVVMLRVTAVADGIKPVHQNIAVKALNAAQWNEWVADRSMPVESGAIVLRELATPVTRAAQQESSSAGPHEGCAEEHLAGDARARRWRGWSGELKRRRIAYIGCVALVLTMLGSAAARRWSQRLRL